MPNAVLRRVVLTKDAIGAKDASDQIVLDVLAGLLSHDRATGDGEVMIRLVLDRRCSTVDDDPVNLRFYFVARRDFPKNERESVE